MSARPMGQRGQVIVISPNLRVFAAALGGEVIGKRVLCPGPGRDPNDRSLSVRLSEMSPDGFVVLSRRGDDLRACRAYVRRRLGRAR
jgi:putative DNA primase/helicase